jgi:predicted nucleotidyltransferase
MNSIDSISNELDALIEIIVQTVPVDQIYLFGSYAYGTPHTDSDSDSDFDLYVVLKNETPMREVEAMDAIGLATYKKRNRALDLLVHKKDIFLDRSTGMSTIEKVVLTEGIKIYG